MSQIPRRWPPLRLMYFRTLRRHQLAMVVVDGEAPGGSCCHLPCLCCEEKVRRITVSQGVLTVAVVPFAFTLQARSDPLQCSIVLHYDVAQRRWHV